MTGPTEGEHSVKAVQSKGAAVAHSSGGKIPYPKHVWSPAGGWYAQPANWKSNTAIMLVIIVGITAAAGKWGAEHEQWHRMPDPNRFTPSRYFSRQLIERDKALAAKAAAEKEAAAKSQQ